MIEIFNRLQKIFGRPITILSFADRWMFVELSWCSKSFVIDKNLNVHEFGTLQPNNYSRWLEGLLRGAKRNDAGELVQKCND